MNVQNTFLKKYFSPSYAILSTTCINASSAILHIYTCRLKGRSQRTCWFLRTTFLLGIIPLCEHHLNWPHSKVRQSSRLLGPFLGIRDHTNASECGFRRVLCPVRALYPLYTHPYEMTFIPLRNSPLYIVVRIIENQIELTVENRHKETELRATELVNFSLGKTI